MTEPQAEFFQLQGKYPLFCGGFGAGKTEALLDCAFRDALEAPTALVAMYEPTYDLVMLVLAGRMQEKLSEHGIRHRHHKRDNIIYTSTRGCGDFVLRTLDNPDRIIGYESYRAHVDEIDTLKPDHARAAWRKIIARNRQRPKGLLNPFNRVSAYTTPEGFRFAYDMWVKLKPPGYEMIQAPTRSNPFLPEDYISSLRASYPAQLIEAYLEGKFVNLTSGSVYPEFDRVKNGTRDVLQPGEAVHIGMDFNVHNMTAVVFAIRDGWPLALEELTKVRDTPAMAELIADRYRNRSVTIYPDASGANTSSKSASVSDFAILQAKNFRICAHAAHPAVRDRVNAVNALILNAKGDRRLKVNVERCPHFTDSLEQLAYDKNGAPEKDSGLDHASDAAGYMIEYRYPIVKPVTKVNFGFAH